MVINTIKDLNYNIGLSIRINEEILGVRDTVREISTLYSTFSSCIYYDSIELQISSIVSKLAQNQSFLDGNKRTSFIMLIYYSNKYNLKINVRTQKEYADMIIRIGTKHLEVEEVKDLLFAKKAVQKPS